MKNICVVGVGYVGLTTGTCLADMGNRVFAIDVSEERVENLRKGILPIYEPGLKDLVERNVKAGRISFSTSYAEGLKDAEFVFICVGTPEGVDGEADLRYVRAAAETIARTMDHKLIVINKSTVPVGTGDWVSQIIKETQPQPIPFAVVSCPEFLREGSAVRDFLSPDRTVLGSVDQDAANAVAQLYLPLRAPIVVTDLRTAEMIKYASNAFLATRISFINEIANICEALGADVKEVAQGMGYDKRIGHSFLEAGTGYGGSCFLPGETIFVVNTDGTVTPQTLEALFAEAGTPYAGDAVEVIAPTGKFVLAFDLDTGCPAVAPVEAFTRRPYQGDLVTITTKMGRTLTVTADHPAIRQIGDRFEKLPSGEVQIGDQLMALTEVNALESLPIAMAAGNANIAFVSTAEMPLAGDLPIARDYVAKVESRPIDLTVYSLETSLHTVIVGSGLISSNCFPKDVKALAYMAQVNGKHPELLQSVMEINDGQRRGIVQKLRDVLGDLNGKVVGVLGLSFKENTDDLRESPSLHIAQLIHEAGAEVRGYDPVAMDNVARSYPFIHLVENSYDLAIGCDALVVATPWNEFKQLDMARIKNTMRQPVLIDGRNLYHPPAMHALGFTYRGVGRGYNPEGEHKPTVITTPGD